jgi:hypothetical protein
MKRFLLATAIVFIAVSAFAQKTETEITSKNSWLKAGLSAGVPVGKTSDYSNFVLGLDLKGN